MIYYTSLWLHIIGITLLAGTTLIDFLLTGKFWLVYKEDPASALLLRKMTSRLPLLTVIGTVLILLSGVGMMAIFHQVIGAMLWFRIKIALVLLIIINGATVGRIQQARLGKLLMATVPPAYTNAALNNARKNIRLVHLTQLALLLAIFFLSAFKFN